MATKQSCLVCTERNLISGTRTNGLLVPCWSDHTWGVARRSGQPTWRDRANGSPFVRNGIHVIHLKGLGLFCLEREFWEASELLGGKFLERSRMFPCTPL